MSIVAFDPIWFKAVYPEFASLSDAQCQNAFVKATFLCDNTDCSVITDGSPMGMRATALAALTAHFLALAGLGDGNSSRQGLVGRISSAGQGSVNVSVDMPTNANTAWYMQTQYGATYWQMVKGFVLGGRWVPPVLRNLDPFNPLNPVPVLIVQTP